MLRQMYFFCPENRVTAMFLQFAIHEMTTILQQNTAFYVKCVTFVAKFASI